jgi:hypothetical protein
LVLRSRCRSNNTATTRSRYRLLSTARRPTAHQQ